MNGHDRAVRLARVAYLGAVRRLVDAMTEFERAGVPLLPDASGRIEAWTPAQQEVMAVCVQAWTEVVRRRRAYEAALREAEHPELWRHA